MKIQLKTPITYYGGKQKLCSRILDLIPPHTLYCESFVGGGAIFFGKPVSKTEVLNDTNKELINFYQVVKNRFVDLETMIRVTLHSRRLHADASVVYNNPHLFDEVKRAWSVWVLSMQSFSSMLDGSWGYDKADNTTSKKISNKRAEFTEEYAQRLQNVQLECADALYIIKSRDTPDSFFYTDPPYFNSNCGHYDGYSEEDFRALLELKSNLTGKFLLSSYDSDLLKQYVKANKWYQVKIEQGVSVNKGYSSKKKIEVLTANYPIK
ncbi:MAG TPA: DNA adenine methylase [Lacibacter sp.]|nr:DNA adenine methylase [Lacibacter sp.]